MDTSYELTLIDGTVKSYMCESIDVTATTITGINISRQIVFVVPVSQVKLLTK